MAPVDGATLTMANQAVDGMIGHLVEATADEDGADPDDQAMLSDHRHAARKLEQAGDKACETELDLPPCDELVNNA